MSARFRFRKILVAGVVVAVVIGCASKVLEVKNVKEIETNEDYDKRLKVKELPIEPSVVESATLAAATATMSADVSVKGAKKPEIKKKAKALPPPEAKKESKVKPHVPPMEDSEGFSGRRPLVDPFRVGEKTTLALSYFNMTAGILDLEVLPFVEVNGEKAYSFKVSARTNGIFSRFYSVDDFATTYISYENLIPLNFEISVKESKQVANIRSIFDWKKLKGYYWEKRVTQDKGEKSKNIEWDIKPFSQNVVSAVYYLRNFTLTPGKKLAFSVADEGKNIVFKGEVLRREEITTDIGKVKTVVVRPQFEVDGVFKQTGEILMWMTDDDRKFLVRIESKIKIGTIVGKIKALEPGH